ncbi:hypothetical protein PIB30_006630 [Stylosanthes scabra]|uniref:Uncharacterized protein n=1 Tax=Stylosanthes scabra TaxID=79078 RepID=A0ABU6Q4F2_9FABA|nr:hypothetical protein [Stylosanthes scabra]
MVIVLQDIQKNKTHCVLFGELIDHLAPLMVEEGGAFQHDKLRQWRSSGNYGGGTWIEVPGGRSGGALSLEALLRVIRV